MRDAFGSIDPVDILLLSIKIKVISNVSFEHISRDLSIWRVHGIWCNRSFELMWINFSPQPRIVVYRQPAVQRDIICSHYIVMYNEFSLYVIV